MFWRARHYVRMKWLDLMLATLSTKHSLKKKASLLVSKLHRTVNQARRRRKRVAKKVRRAAKDALIVSLPGVTKVQLPPSPTPQLLVSNHPPSDFESVLITSAIEKAEAESRRWTQILEQRMATGHSTRAWEMITVHRIAQANRFASRHKSLISPIRRLPIEILQEIFLWLAETTVLRAAPNWRHNNTLPWVLGQICSPWRSIALNTTALWVKLPVITLKKKSRKINIQLQYLEELLHRSKGALLDISIYARYFGGESHNVIDLLCRHAERWESVYLCLPPQALVAFRSIRGRLSALQSLTLVTLMINIFGPIDLFEVAPALTKVSVAKPFESGGDVILPFKQIVHYKERLTFGHMLTPVFHSPVLETLTILEISDDTLFPSLTIPHLVKLHVAFEYQSHPDFFKQLTLPAIEEITVVSYRGKVMPGLASMLAKNSPSSLKSLSARMESIDKNELTNVLVHTPQLVTLNITLPSFSSDILNLASGYHNRPLSPLLETCEFYADDLINQDLTKALNLLAYSRCELGNDADDINVLLPGEVRPLRNLIIQFDRSATAYLQHGRLENWSITPISTLLEELNTHLYDRLPDLPFGYSSQPKKLSIGWNDKLGRILADIESVEVDDAEDIYMSRVHYSLKIISNWAKSDHGNCAQRILDKWQPSIEESLKYRRWAFRRPYALVYISKENALRNSLENALTIAYGLKERVPLVSALWSIFLEVAI